MAFRAALFDLDGTLLDTGEGVLGAACQVIHEKGCPPLAQDLLRTFIGPPIKQSFAQTFALDEDEATRWTARFRELYSKEYLLYARPYEGIYEVCKTLREAGIPQAVATYKPEGYARELLEHFGFGDYMQHMLGSDIQGKLSKADIIERAAGLLDVPHAEALMVGDTVHDAMGAQKLGMPFLGVTYGYGFTGQGICEYQHVGMAAHPIDILTYFDASM